MAYDPSTNTINNTSTQIPSNLVSTPENIATYQQQGGTLTNGKIPTLTAPTGTDSNSPTLVPIPQVPTTINSTNTQPSTIPTLQPTVPTTTDPFASLNGIPSVATIENNNNVVNTPEAQRQLALNNRLESLMGSEGTKAADTATAYGVSGGVNDITAQLNDLNSQITTLKNNAQAIPFANENAAIGKTGEVGVQARNTVDLRNNAIQALTLNSLASTLQGKLATAKASADQAIALKYDPIENEIKVAQQQITDNMPFFTAAEQKVAATTQAELTDRANQVAAQKENETAVQGIVATAITDSNNNGTTVPTLLLQQASKLTDPTQARLLLAPYLKDNAAIQKAIDEHNLSVSQQIKNEKDNKTATVAEQKQNATDTIDTLINTPYDSKNAIINGKYDKNADIKILDQNGNFTVQGFNALIALARSKGIDRQTFLKQYGSYLGDVSTKKAQTNYGLTPADIKIINTKV